MISIERKDAHTIFKVTGEVTARDIVLYSAQYMAGEQTATAMWDFTRAAKVSIATEELKGIADILKKFPQDGKVRKVALVSSKNINIGLGKLYAAFAQMVGLPYKYKVFRNTTQAMRWLQG